MTPIYVCLTLTNWWPLHSKQRPLTCSTGRKNMREHIRPNYTNMWTIHTHPQHTPARTEIPPPATHSHFNHPTHMRDPCSLEMTHCAGNSMLFRLLQTGWLTVSTRWKEEKKKGRFYSVVIRESGKEEEKTKQNTRISVQKNRRKTVPFHVKPQWLSYYTQGHSETAGFTSNHNTVETKERKSYECLNMRNSCFLDYYCLTALPKMLLAKRQTKRKAQRENDPNAIHILYDECLSCQS